MFEETFFPLANESFHGMFGLINLHGVPKPTYRAYQLLHETGDLRLNVTRPVLPPPSHRGSCGTYVTGQDVYGGDLAILEPCPTCGLFSEGDCCDACVARDGSDGNTPCDVAELWTSQPTDTHGYKCALKSWEQRQNVSQDQNRRYSRVTRPPAPPTPPSTLCARNTGVLAVQNGTNQLDLLVYNHAAFAATIVNCNVTVRLDPVLAAHFSLNSTATTTTVRRIDEQHANPLATWIAMGAPDYTTSQQNEEILRASQLVVEHLHDVVVPGSLLGTNEFTMPMGPHSVAAVRVLAL